MALEMGENIDKPAARLMMMFTISYRPEREVAAGCDACLESRLGSPGSRHRAPIPNASIFSPAGQNVLV